MQIIDYDGNRDLAGFAAFLKEQTGVDIDAGADADDSHDEL